jgi:hypothetical protein
MRRALRHAARLSLAVGALGLVHPVLAADPMSPARTVPVTAMHPVHPSQAQLEGMRIELAWYSDPATFGHPLEIRARTDALELWGTVPDEQVHQRILAIAKQNSYMPLVDRLRILGSSGHSPVLPAAELHRAAMTCLAEVFGPRAANFNLEAGSDGKVTVRGSVDCVEDKLAVSRELSKLPSCTVVHNELTVKTVLRHGQTATLVTRDGHHAVRGSLDPDPAPGLTLAEATPAEPEASQKPHIVTKPAAPIQLPPAPSLALPTSVPAPTPKITVPTAPKPMVVVQPEEHIDAVPAPAPAPQQPTSLRARLFSGLVNYHPIERTVVPKAVPPQATPPQAPSQYVTSPWQIGANPVPANGHWPSAYPTEPAPLPTPGARPTGPKPFVPVTMPITPAAADMSIHPPDDATIAPVAMHEVEVLPPQVQSANRERGLIFPSKPPQTPPPTEKASTQAPTQQSAKEIDASKLQHKIQTACGTLVKKVAVTRTADHGLKVHVEVKGPATNDKSVIDRILQVPEMLVPGVVLDLQINP